MATSMTKQELEALSAERLQRIKELELQVAEQDKALIHMTGELASLREVLEETEKARLHLASIAPPDPGPSNPFEAGLVQKWHADGSWRDFSSEQEFLASQHAGKAEFPPDGPWHDSRGLARQHAKKLGQPWPEDRQ